MDTQQAGHVLVWVGFDREIAFSPDGTNLRTVLLVMIVSYQDQNTRRSSSILRRAGPRTRAIPDKPHPSDASPAFPQPASNLFIGRK